MVVRSPLRRRQRGVAYLILLFMVVLLGVGLAAGGTVWQLHARREKEAELLFIGDEVRRAIDGYYENSPAAAMDYPQRLEDLLEDRRLPLTKRYLRRIYVNPFSNKVDWGLVVVNNRLIGIYSQAAGTPITRSGFSTADSTFGSAKSYSDWRFISLNAASTPPMPPSVAPRAPAPASPRPATPQPLTLQPR
ncbi:MAG: hypothetical protein JWN73_1331 [Betaproteobacteria bacterium]|nr:hypothetical protein [Betaproteobacteria bacterium]